MLASDTIALYLHWPYCISKCNYCAFNSIATSNPDHQSWRRAILKELHHEALSLRGRKLSSIYFGGGTPSLIPTQYLQEIIELAVQYWPNDDIEITLEANPATVDQEKLPGCLSAGVNRLSIGVQSFNNDLLSFLGRKHTGEQAEEAFLMARKAGFSNISLDLIFAVPGQTELMLNHDLDRVTALNPQHISVYQLSLEENTKLYQDHISGLFKLLDEDVVLRQFDIVHKKLTKAGYRHYEVSNFAKPGYESRHNLAYWKYQEYLGLGPGAHSRVIKDGEVLAMERASDIQVWAADPIGSTRTSKLSKTEIFNEILIMGLRTAEGISITDLAKKVGAQGTDEFLASSAVQELIGLGMLKKDSNYLRIPECHRLKTDAIERACLQ
ncbi:MAG: radical SAM family heme chaperone HemW [Holosporales bacterium]|jgi:oxygen-independent coproporphyrinogen-3 oxidase|nr:radical SAM family heme chaperone HemW [Holosporales bacterium]